VPDQPVTEEVPAARDRSIGRAAAAWRALVILLCWLVVWLAFATVGSLFKGAHVGVQRPESDVIAVVEQCDRSGPVSRYGFGYWWTCRISVDGSNTGESATVGRSVVTNDDVGKSVTLKQSCDVDGDCTYGRATAQFWGFVVAVIGIVQLFAALLIGVAFLLYAANAVLGRRAFNRGLDRVSKAQGRKRNGSPTER
jgi:hypothetical protein